MQSIFQENKLILAFLFSFLPITASVPITSDKTIELLKKADHALEGWSKLRHKWVWSNTYQKDRINSYCATLRNIKEELAILLAQLNSPKLFPKKQAQCSLQHYETQIIKYESPSHLKRNWIHYSTAAVGLIGGTYLLSHYGYDENGNHALCNFYKEHIKEPVIAMYADLTKNNVNKIVLEEDPQAALERVERKTNLDIENAKRDPRLKEIVSHYVDVTIPVEQVPQEDKIAFSRGKRTFHTTHLAEQCNQLTWKDIVKVQIPKDFEPTIVSTNTLIEWYEVKLMLLMKEIQRLHRTVKLMQTIPAMFVSYLCLNSLKKYWTQYKINTTYKPLKKTLIRLQLQFNKDRYSKVISPLGYGMSLYWLSQLKEALVSIPIEEHATYSYYLEQIEDQTLEPEQKITIIDNMFRDISCLQKV